MSSAMTCYPVQQQHNTQTQYYSFGPDHMAQVHLQYTHTTQQALEVSQPPVDKGSKVKGCGKSRKSSKSSKLRAVLHTRQIVKGLHTTIWAFKDKSKGGKGGMIISKRVQKPVNYVRDVSYVVKTHGC